MQSTLLMTLASHFRKARSVNQTSNGFVSKIPTATTPAADTGSATAAAAIDLSDTPTGYAQNALLCCFYGTGSNNQSFSARIIGWKLLGPDNADTKLWIPVPLIEVACTLSSTPIGVANKTVVAAELFADTIALTGTTANDDVSVDIVSPANDTIAHLVVDVKGFQKVEFSFTTGGSATDCNALLALL